MSWVAAAVAVGTAAYGAYNSYSTKKEAEANKKDLFGRRAKTAPFVPLNLSDEQRKAVEGNLSNKDSIDTLLNRMMPGFSDILKQGSTNTLSELRGEIPKDVQDSIYRQSAFQALSGGFGGSGMAHALTARDLGKTSLDLTNMGNNSAQLWSQFAKQNYDPYMVSTGDYANATAVNNQGLQNALQHQYNVDAGADPGTAGAFNVSVAQNQAQQANLQQAGTAFSNAYAQQQGVNYNGYSVPRNSQWTYDSSTGRYMPVMAAAPAGRG